jgi:hypothetical protein
VSKEVLPAKSGSNYDKNGGLTGMPRHARLKVLLVGLSLAGAVHGTAHAQAVPPLPNAQGLDQFEPIGGRIGSFLLFPTFETRIEYDDNVLALAEDAVGDAEVTLRGAARLKSQWARHSLEMNAYIQQNFHARLTSEDAMEGGARVDTRLDASRNTSVRLIASVDSLAENRAEITAAANALEPTRFRRSDALLSIAHDFGRLRLTGDAEILVLDFDDVPARDGGVIRQDFRNSVYVRSAVTAALELSPRVAALLRGQIDRLTFNDDPIDPFDRDTTGYAVEGGLRLEFDRILFGEARVGVLHREVDDPTGRGLTGVSFGANLTWLATPLTTVRLFADRQVEEGGSQLVSGNIRSQARLVVNHELLRNVTLEGQAGYARIDTIGQINVTGQEYNLMAEATWRLDRNFRVFARADRFHRFAGDDFFREFVRNRVMAGVRVAF